MRVHVFVILPKSKHFYYILQFFFFVEIFSDWIERVPDASLLGVDCCILALVHSCYSWNLMMLVYSESFQDFYFSIYAIVDFNNRNVVA